MKQLSTPLRGKDTVVAGPKGKRREQAEVWEGSLQLKRLGVRKSLAVLCRAAASAF